MESVTLTKVHCKHSGNVTATPFVQLVYVNKMQKKEI
jgi:hypothetical protein